MLKVIKAFLRKFFKRHSDPVRILPKKAMELVLSQMKVDELLRLSMVNKKWMKFIGNSEKSMERIKFVVCEPFQGLIWKFEATDATNMIKHGRKYKNIALFVTRSLTKDHLLLVALHEWKSINLCHHTFKSEIELTNFLGLVEPFVEDLDLRYIKILYTKQNEIASANFIFPRLRKLKVSHCCTFVFSEIFKNVNGLETLEIETGPLLNDEETSKRALSIEEILINNVNLKNLCLYLHQTDFDGIFLNLPRDARMKQPFLNFIGFQLETLKVKNFKKVEEINANAVQINNFSKFLKSQLYSLTSLTMYDCLGFTVLETVINSMEWLKTLKLADLSSYSKLKESIANVTFYNNESIENLTFVSRHSEFCDLQTNLIATVPNLKTLTVGTVNQIMLEALIDETPKLLKLSVNNFSAYLPPEYAVLNDLKEMEINVHYASNFKDQLRNYKEHQYTNFEKVFLRAVKVFHDNNNCLY